MLPYWVGDSTPDFAYIRKCFGKLGILMCEHCCSWWVPVENDRILPDTYEIEVVRPKSFPGNHLTKSGEEPINRRVTFRDRGHDPLTWAWQTSECYSIVGSVPEFRRPLPDVNLIALHRALCHILHSSGAGVAFRCAMFNTEIATVTEFTKARDADNISLVLENYYLHEDE
ncbi:hypothetical protein M422DRAFT_45036 [Sphaerobolus stellatus SS14]|nr:hypothetical protein M422DRAFT_45036 [Sphaerobolus stellatus SS14]